MTWQPVTYSEGLRMAWDETDDGVEHCLNHIEPYLPGEGLVLDLGCGVGRLTVPVAERHPRLHLVGLDTSPEMIHLAAQHPRVSYETERLDRVYDAAYSVVTFQHMPDDQMLDYLRWLAWMDGISVVLQFVDGTERTPLSMQRPTGWVREWCHSAGFNRVDVETDERFPNWRWVHAH